MLPNLSEFDIIGFDVSCTTCPDTNSNWVHAKKTRFYPIEDLDLDLSKYTALSIHNAFSKCTGCGRQPSVSIRSKPINYGGCVPAI